MVGSVQPDNSVVANLRLGLSGSLTRAERTYALTGPINNHDLGRQIETTKFTSKLLDSYKLDAKRIDIKIARYCRHVSCIIMLQVLSDADLFNE